MDTPKGLLVPVIRHVQLKVLCCAVSVDVQISSLSLSDVEQNISGPESHFPPLPLMSCRALARLLLSYPISRLKRLRGLSASGTCRAGHSHW